MGENPDTVFTTGALGIDSIRATSLLSKETLEKELNFLYYASSVGHYRDVETRLMEYVSLLERLYGSEENGASD